MRRRPYAPWLAAIVGASFLIRTAVGWLRAAPALFPDEYTYAALARSIASTGHATIRGGSPGFPALLEPIVTAPAWLVSDVGLAYRLVQTMGALTMSLAAVPAFLLARRLGLSGRVALVVAALSVLVPDTVYSSFVTSESLAYPLVLAALYAAVCSLAEPSRRSQVLFVVFAGLAALARIQFAVVPVVFVIAAAAVGLRERRVRAALKEQRLPIGVFALAAAAAVVSGPSRVLGPYRAVLGFRGSPLTVVHWGALDAMTLAYAAGWIVIPGAVLGLWLSVRTPRSRPELCFGVLTILFAAAILFEAGALQANLPLGREIQERYVFYAAPLAAIAFALYASRGWPLRLVHLGLAAALLLVSVRVPLSGYSIAATLNGSPILYAVYWLTSRFGHAGTAATLVAAIAGVLSVGAIVGSRWPRVGTPLAFSMALLVSGVASAGAVAFDVSASRADKTAYLPSDPSWVDRAKVGDVAYLQAWGASRGSTLQHLFWNRSLNRVVLLPGAAGVDRYPAEVAKVSRDGSLLIGGHPLGGPLLLDEWGSALRLTGAHELESGPTASLWVPERGSRPRLELYALGRYHDGWLADRGAIYLWPKTAGWLTMRLTSPVEAGANTVTFQLPGGESTAVALQSGKPQVVHLAVCRPGQWYATYKARLHGFIGLRAVSVRATVPVFRPDTGACPAPEPVP